MNPEVENCKKLGNDCIKQEKYVEAMIHYTQAIKLDPFNHVLYSNRSLAFLKMEQYYHALEDAKECIELNPEWAKGYYRRGEVEFKAEHYSEALQSYKRGLAVSPDDTGLQNAADKALSALRAHNKNQAWMPWKGLGFGLLLGISICIADEVLTNKPVLTHVVMKLLTVLAFCALGYGAAILYRSFLDSQRASQLEEPLDLLGDDKDKREENQRPSTKESKKREHKSSSSSETDKHSRKGSHAQGRQRFRKGKS